MPNITRYDPFNFTRIDPFGDLDDIFKGFLVRPVGFEGQPRLQIKMDLKENDGAYTVHADIPGVKKEDIHVSIEGNQVSISAETRTEKEEKKARKCCVPNATAVRWNAASRWRMRWMNPNPRPSTPTGCWN